MKQLVKSAIVLCAASLLALQARATVIIQDDFSQPNADTGTHSPYNVYGVNIWDGAPGSLGLPPNFGTTSGSTRLGTNLPGGVWKFGGGANADYDAKEVGNLAGYGATPLYLTGGTSTVTYASLHNNEGVAISTGTYNVNSTLTITISVAPATSAAYVGFDSALNVSNNFSGLKVDTTGGVSLLVSGTQVGSTIPFTGTFTGTSASQLKFTVNTASGSISNVTLQNSTSAYNFTTSGFTSAATPYVALYTPGGSGAAKFAGLTVESSPAVGVTAVQANSFLNSIGVCTHITQGADNPANVATCLTYAGIRNIRDDGTTNATKLQSFITVHNTSGAMVDLLPINGNIASSLAEYETLSGSGALLAVEGPNEPNNFAVNYLGQSSAGTKLTTTTSGTINNSASFDTSYHNNSDAGHSYVPVGFTYGSSTAFVTGETTLGALRNNFTGWVGFKFTTGTSAITVNQLGRWVVSGNTGTHNVELVQVSGGTVLGTVSVNTSGATAGAFKYVALGTSIPLAANTAYYVLSQETSGGDQWCDAGYDSFPIAYFQRDLYSAVKADPKLAGIPVFASSEAGGSEPQNVGLQYLTIPTPLPTGVLMPAGTVYADYANPHNYVCANFTGITADNIAWNAEDPTLNSSWDGLYKEYGHTWWSPGYTGYTTTQLQTLPRVTTETGWVTQGTNAITQDQQGKLFLNLYLDAYKRDWSCTFVYYLHDTASQGYWGFFDTSYTAKLSGTYLHNMTTILADTSSFTPGLLNYSIPSEPATVHDLLMQKSNGTFYLAVWDERSGATPDAVTVNLGATYSSVNVYDPTVGTTATQTFSNVSSVSLTLLDHPLIISVQ